MSFLSPDWHTKNKDEFFTIEWKREEDSDNTIQFNPVSSEDTNSSATSGTIRLATFDKLIERLVFTRDRGLLFFFCSLKQHLIIVFFLSRIGRIQGRKRYFFCKIYVLCYCWCFLGETWFHIHLVRKRRHKLWRIKICNQVRIFFFSYFYMFC